MRVARLSWEALRRTLKIYFGEKYKLNIACAAEGGILPVSCVLFQTQDDRLMKP